MTSQEIITVFSALIAALTVAAVNIITALKTNAKVDAVKEGAEAIAERVEGRAAVDTMTTVATVSRVDEKLDAIHDLTNSNLTKVNVELGAALTRIEKLEDLLMRVMGTPALREIED